MTSPRRALVVIDVQQEYFEGLLPIQYPPRDQSIRRITQAMDAANESGIPVVVVQHESPADFPVFAAGSPTYELHPEIASRLDKAEKHLIKRYSSVFADTDLEAWLREREIDTVTLVGYMTNNCVLGSAADAEPRGIAVEVLADATGAVDLANDPGFANAQQVHETLLALLHSNWAAVATTEEWIAAISSGDSLEKGNLVASAAEGRNRAQPDSALNRNPVGSPVR